MDDYDEFEQMEFAVHYGFSSSKQTFEEIQDPRIKELKIDELHGASAIFLLDKEKKLQDKLLITIIKSDGKNKKKEKKEGEEEVEETMIFTIDLLDLVDV